MASFERIEGGVRLTANPVTLTLGGVDIEVQSEFTIMDGSGKVITTRRILNDLHGESVTFEEYFTGGFGTTEYQADMSALTLGVGEKSMGFEYHGRKIVGRSSAWVNIPDVSTKLQMGGDIDEAQVEEGIAFSPVYRLALRKTISKGEVKTWLNLQKAD